MKPIEIITWPTTDNTTTLVKSITPKFINIGDNNRPYIHNTNLNVKNIARLFAISLPGCDCDVIYTAIASNLRDILQSKNGKDLLLTKHDIEARIRMTINELAELE